MDIRKVQRTGDMHYVYLPTAWCKEHKIKSGSPVRLSKASGGSLMLSPEVGSRSKKHIKLSVKEDNLDTINKLIIACYTNPADSFEITLDKPLDQHKLLEQRQIISVELFDIDGPKISCESFVQVSSCEALLKTMVGKIQNILTIMTSEYSKELIQRYEEEIDKQKILITKAVISALTHNSSTKLRTIDLHYISLIAKDLELLADHLIIVDRKEQTFFKQVAGVMKELKEVIALAVDNKKLRYPEVVSWSKKIHSLSVKDTMDMRTYHLVRVQHYLLSIAEVLFDWAITNETEK